MPKLPSINEIINTIRGSAQSAPTRRDVLRQGVEQFMPEDSIEEVLQNSITATEFFKRHPDLWNPEWGPLEMAEPEDIADALQRVMSELRGGMDGGLL